MPKYGKASLPETYLKIADEILELLQQRDVSVSEEFVLMIVRVIALAPENKFVLKQFLEPSELERMKQITVERIMSMTPLARQTILMQLYFKDNFCTKEEVKQSEEGESETKITEILQELAKEMPTQLKQREAYYQRLLYATILKTGIKISWGRDVQLEFALLEQTRDALSSIFPQDDIDLITSLKPSDREAELLHMIKIAVGIRILNKSLDPEKLGAGILDLDKIMVERIKSSLDILSQLRNKNTTRMVLYTTAIKPVFLDPNVTKRPGRRGFTKDVLLIRQGLTMVHQILSYIRILDQELCKEDMMTESLLSMFNTAIENLKSTISANEAVMNLSVYLQPKYLDLANTWTGIRESLAFSTNCEKILIFFRENSEERLQETDMLVNKRLTGVEVPLSVEEFLAPAPEHVPLDQIEGSLVRRSSFTDNDHFLDSRYSGFCVWSLVEGFGMLIFSNPLLGIYHWNEKKYLLSHAEAAVQFANDPESFIFKAILIALKWPELIYLLKMEDEVFYPKFAEEAIRESTIGKPFLYADAEIQTELHPSPKNIVEGYSWNEWDYRRRALILADVHNSVTHSTQTYIQAIRASESTQTYPPRNTRVQTHQNSYAEAPRSQFYFFGLRGHHCSPSYGPQPPHIVNLTREPVLDMNKIRYATSKNRKGSGDRL